MAEHNDINAVASIEEKPRLEFLDMMRGICVLLMVVYHGLYVLSQYFTVGQAFGERWYNIFEPFQVVVASIFIMISGFSAQLSAKPRLRAWLLVCISLAFSLVTILLLPLFGFENTAIWFGILHLLACGKLLYAYGKNVIDKIPGFAGLLVSLLLFFYTAPVGQKFFGIFGALRVNIPEALYQSDVLFFLGIKSPSFVSWDWFPLLPWVFLFLFGVFVGRMVPRDSLPEYCYRKRPFLALVGRVALPIYILHVPVLYGLFALVETVAR